MKTPRSFATWMLIGLTGALLLLAIGNNQPTAAASNQAVNVPQGGATATPCTLPFVDLVGNQHLEAIQYLYCAGAITGTDGTHFSPQADTTAVVVIHALDVLFPDYTPTPTVTGCTAAPHDPCPTPDPTQRITRAQLAKVVVQRAALPTMTPTGGQTFQDVPSSYFAYVYIESINAANIMGGFSDQTFRPGNIPPRDLFCQILYNALRVHQGTPLPQPTSIPAATDTPAATPTLCAMPFVDLGGNVFAGAINYLYCAGVVNGTDSTHYSPAGNTTRAQFAKVIVLAFHIPIPTNTPCGHVFTDVTSDFWGCQYIEAAYRAGIIAGYDAQTCAAIGQPYPCYLPNRPVTRAQVAKLLVNAANCPLFTPTGGQTFTDVGPSNIFYVFIETAHNSGIIYGYPDDTFRPNNNVRRDEMAQMVYRTLLNCPGYGTTATPTPTTIPNTPTVTPTVLPANVVAVEDFRFYPQTLTVTVGTTVRWVNNGSAPHNVTANDNAWNSPMLDAGDTYTHTFSTSGSFGYYCINHGNPNAGMRGSILVVPMNRP